MSDKTMT